MSGMDAAGGWYTSGTFWAGAGTICGVLGVVAIVWVTLVVGIPRRRLFYRMRAIAPLVSAPEGLRGDLELRHRGKLLSNPRALTVELVSRGRKDIANDAYNDGKPLRLDVGAPVVELLQVVSEPATLPPPVVAIDGTSVNIGPSLIGRRHAITITVLTDGGRPSLRCQSPLIDVQVRERSEEPRTAPLLIVAALISATAISGITLTFTGYYNTSIEVIVSGWVLSLAVWLFSRSRK
jgi:hypothetical protein